MTVAAPAPTAATFRTSPVTPPGYGAPQWQRDRLAEAAHLGPSTGFVLAVVLTRTNWRTGQAWALSEAAWCLEAGGMPARTWRYHLARLRAAGVLWTIRPGRGRGRGRGVAVYAVTSGNPLPVVATRENTPPAPPRARAAAFAYKRQPIAALSASAELPIPSVSSPRARASERKSPLDPSSRPRAPIFRPDPDLARPVDPEALARGLAVARGALRGPNRPGAPNRPVVEARYGRPGVGVPRGPSEALERSTAPQMETRGHEEG